MADPAPLPPDLAELVADENAPDDARKTAAIDRMSVCADVSLVPILKRALAEKRGPDEFGTVCRLLGHLTNNTGDADAAALLKWLFERPKIPIWQYDAMLCAAWLSGRKELAPLVRPFFTLHNGRFVAWAKIYVERTNDDEAVETVLPLLETPGTVRTFAMFVLHKFRPPAAIPALLALIHRPPASKKKEEFESRYCAFDILMDLANAEIADEIARLRAHPMFKKFHYQLLVGLCRAGVPEQAELVAEMGLSLYEKSFFAGYKDVRVCSAALEYFERIGHADGPNVRALLGRLVASAWRLSPEDCERLERLRSRTSAGAS